ncbi:hypothetical protein GOC05_06815 [Sinorhizobium meliloti]|nr:hypothetical protein [Sinorhizobium meliloti]
MADKPAPVVVQKGFGGRFAEAFNTATQNSTPPTLPNTQTPSHPSGGLRQGSHRMHEFREWISEITLADLSASATVATLVVTSVAAWFALDQYWRSRSMAELEALDRLREQIFRLSDEMTAALDSKDAGKILAATHSFLSICELYAGAVLKTHLPKLTREYVTHFLTADLLKIIKHPHIAPLVRYNSENRYRYKYIREFAALYGHDCS